MKIDWKKALKQFLLYVLLPLLGLETAAEQLGLFACEPAPQTYAASAPRIDATEVLDIDCVTEPAREFVNENYRYTYVVEVQVFAKRINLVGVANFPKLEIPDQYLITKRVKFTSPVSGNFFAYRKPEAVREFFTECLGVGEVANLVDAPDLVRTEKIPRKDKGKD